MIYRFFFLCLFFKLWVFERIRAFGVSFVRGVWFPQLGIQARIGGLLN